MLSPIRMVPIDPNTLSAPLDNWLPPRSDPPTVALPMDCA
jgi:hypothetical protein